MREHSRDKGRLEDIKQYAQNVEIILDGITFDAFVQDIRVYYSVMKNIEVVGEAANMLTKDFKEQHPELPWRQIVKMRNVLVHGYAQVSNVDLWDTATNDIKVLLAQVNRYLSEIDSAADIVQIDTRKNSVYRKGLCYIYHFYQIFRFSYRVTRMDCYWI